MNVHPLRSVPMSLREYHAFNRRRVDGTLAPCFTYYSRAHDWGKIGAPRIDLADLAERRAVCTARCLSTCQHTLGYAYHAGHAVRWLVRQARHGFRGVTGSF